jgi:hypothetical protein
LIPSSQTHPKKFPLAPPPPPKLPLGVTLKLEVARCPPTVRPTALEAAYALEELLGAVEAGQT